MNIDATTLVSDIAAESPATLRTFERHGIDFCCGGRRALGQVCEEKGLDLDALAAELARDAAGPAPEKSWEGEPLADLAEHIVARYHEGLRRELPRLAGLLEAVQDAHGARHGAVLGPLADTFYGLRQELEVHMMKEEQILFPYIRELEAGTGGQTCGAILGPISVMEEEHESAGRALARMRELTSDYTPPADACNTFRGLFHGLAELETDLHTHIHLENNVLFPRAVVLEEKVAG